MGTWGTGIFDNDGAGDFLSELTEAPNGWAIVRGALLSVAEAPASDLVDAPECEMALVAAECVAVARGKPSAAPEVDLIQWCEEHPLKDSSKLAALAASAVRRIRTSSELKQLWEAGDDREWGAVLADLEKRLL